MIMADERRIRRVAMLGNHLPRQCASRMEVDERIRAGRIVDVGLRRVVVGGDEDEVRGGGVDLALIVDGIDDERVRAIDMIDRNARSQVTLIEELLHVCQLDAGHREVAENQVE